MSPEGAVAVPTEGPLAPCGALPAGLAPNARARRALRVLLEKVSPMLPEFVVVCPLPAVLALLPPILHTIIVPGLEDEVNKALNPHQILLVVDAMTGQDAVNSAKAFHEQLSIDGVILTKFDSDTRGGAALTVRKITGAPLKFIGTG